MPPTWTVPLPLPAQRSVEQLFIASVIEPLRRGDEPALRAELEARWPADQLVAFLQGMEDDAAKVAAACLGVVGTMRQVPALAAALRHDDTVVVTMAEHSLWKVWCHAGPHEAVRDLHQAKQWIAARRYDEAVALLNDVALRAPEFAEAYNQRAIASYATGRFEAALGDCRRTLALNRFHFGALAGLGHGYAQLGQYERALAAYHAALRIHPRMEGIRQSIRRVRIVANATGAPLNSRALG